MKPSRRQFLGGAAASALATGCPPVHGGGASTTQPNFLHIMLDDAGWWDRSRVNGNVDGATQWKVWTPNMDAFDTTATAFTNQHTTPLCSATRVGVLTGRDAHLQQFPPRGPDVHNPDGSHRLGIPLWSRSIMQILKWNGYTTGHFGKWHLGWQSFEHPNACGVDQFVGIINGSVDSYTKEDIKIQHLGEQRWQHNGVVGYEEGHITDLIEWYARDFIINNQAVPWYANVWLTAPHVPMQVPPVDLGSPARPGVLDWFNDYYPPNIQNYYDPNQIHRRYYAAMLSYADAAIGRILAELDATGQADNTVVLITNDNGGDTLYAINYPLRGGKNTFYEGGVRTHCGVRAPGILPQGVQSNYLVSHIDWFPSVLEIAGIPQDPSWYGLNGRSFQRTLADGDSDRVLTWWSTPGRFAQLTNADKLLGDSSTLTYERFLVNQGDRMIDEQPSKNVYGATNPPRP